MNDLLGLAKQQAEEKACSALDIFLSKNRNIITSCKSKQIKANNYNAVPINVDNPTHMIHVTLCHKVMKG